MLITAYCSVCKQITFFDKIYGKNKKGDLVCLSCIKKEPKLKERFNQPKMPNSSANKN